MSRKTDPECLETLSDRELDHLLEAGVERVETRASRCLHDNRDLTEREAKLMADDKAEMVAIKSEIELRARNAETAKTTGRFRRLSMHTRRRVRVTIESRRSRCRRSRSSTRVRRASGSRR
jgi:hypothetical protein